MNKNQPQTIATINNQTIVTVENNGEVCVPIRPICDALNLSYSGQFESLKEDANFASTVRHCRMVAADGKERDMVCLPLLYVYLWLGGINPNRVKEEARQSVINYRMECAQALYDHFTFKARRANEQAQKEIELLKQKDEAKSRLGEAKALIRSIDDKLEALREERINPQPTLF